MQFCKNFDNIEILTETNEAIKVFLAKISKIIIFCLSQGTREPGLYILDCLFSVLVIGSLVVFVWRGLWVLLDLRLFPEDKALSAWSSLVSFSIQFS